ncbi:MAG: tetratricopeptide repeat protein, partial [Acidobacteriaceae bacterium]
MIPPKQYVLLLLLATAICLPKPLPAQTNTDTEAQQHFQLAHQAQAAGQLDTAAAEYQKVIRLKPEVAEGYASLGLVYYAQSKFADSARVLEQAYKLNPRLPGVSLVLGLDSIKLYHPARAIPYLRQAISLEPANKQAQSSLGT